MNDEMNIKAELNDKTASLAATVPEPGSLLVFPATAEAGLEIPELILERGENLILASSVIDRLDLGIDIHSVVRLPTIYAENFEREFLSLLDQFSVRRIYCPVASVYGFLSEFIATRQLPVTVIGDSPQKRAVAMHMNLSARAEQLFAFSSVCCETEAARQLRDLTALLLQARQIYGETSEEKIAGLFAAMSCAVQGDVVEIGAFMGRSAFALGFLARLFGIGPLLAIDPWSRDAAVQFDSPPVVQAMADACGFDDVFDIFLTNMHFLPQGSVNYLRQTSRQAIDYYGGASGVETAEFGLTQYSGTIAVLHVDGNHDYEEVLADCRLWLPHLGDGGWLILDDYVWAHGDGPQRVGDIILEACVAEISQAFVCGKSLFLRFISINLAKEWAVSACRQVSIGC